MGIYFLKITFRESNMAGDGKSQSSVHEFPIENLNSVRGFPVARPDYQRVARPMVYRVYNQWEFQDPKMVPSYGILM